MNHYCVLAFTLMSCETHKVTYYSVILSVDTQFANTDCTVHSICVPQRRMAAIQNLRSRIKVLKRVTIYCQRS